MENTIDTAKELYKGGTLITNMLEIEVKTRLYKDQ